MKKFSTKEAVLLVSSLVLAGGILGGLGFYYAKVANESKNQTIDDTQLFIGIPYKADETLVELDVTATGVNGTSHKLYSAGDLKTIVGQDPDVRYLDYASNPLVPLDGKTIGQWLNEEKNTLSVYSVGLGLINSAPVKLDKSGIWFINVASQDGVDPEVKHAYCYKTAAKEA